LGTANVLACEIGLPRRPERLADTVLRGVPRAITLGEIDGRRFALMVGVGFDARAVAGVNERLKRRLGRAAYAWSVVRRVVDFDFPRYRFRADGAVGEASSLVVANARMYGGPHVLAASAGLARPELVLCRLDGGRASLLALGAKLFTVGLGRGLATSAVRRIEIEGPEGEPVQADGDIVATLPVTVRALPGALRLVYPPGASSAMASTT
jgi:diacylglycerol kinase family enzyme